MTIATREDLLNAAGGVFKPREIFTNSNTYAPGQLAGDINRTGASSTATNQYANLMAGAKAPGGLSAKGKYGGFYTSADQEQAIRGSAINLAKGIPQQLRSTAKPYLDKLNTMYGEASTKYLLPEQKAAREQMGFNPVSSSAGSARMFEETSSNRTPLLRNYANQLSTWYQKEAAPAKEYLSTAKQLESTPLSSLASSIATSAYGMNPNLATSKFGNLDTEYLKQQRDTESVLNYGMTYDERQKALEDAKYGTSLTKETKGLESLAGIEIENLTRVGSKFLSANTGQTAKQMYDVLQPTFEYVDPSTNTKTVGSGSYFAQQYSQYLTDGDEDSADKLLNSVPQDRQDLRRLLTAIKSVMLTKQGKSAMNAMQYQALADLGSENP